MKKFLLFSLVSFFFSQGFCLSLSVGGNADTLDKAISDAALDSTLTLFFSLDVPLELYPQQNSAPVQVRAFNSTPDFKWVGFDQLVEGFNHVLDGKGQNVRGFFVGGKDSSSTGSFTLTDLTIQNCTAQGGSGCGGGMGAGGGLYVGENTIVNLTRCGFINCSAAGGNGSNSSSVKGGGGMRGNGPSGGGGFGGNGSSEGYGGGSSGFSQGDATSSNPGSDFGGSRTEGADGVGGGLISNANGGFGGGGATSGTGGFGGGGGGGVGGDSGQNGGFGGGGGQAGPEGLFGGIAGFGAGGGFPQGSGGFGGGDASSTFGGSGAGFGGAIFVEENAELTFTGSLFLFNNTAIPATKGLPSSDPIANGGALGNDIFMMSSSTVIFDLTEDFFLLNPIDSNQGKLGLFNTSTTGGGLTKKGSNLLSLVGDNTYTGTTKVEAGELRLDGSTTSNIEVSSGATFSGSPEVKVDASGQNGGNITNSGLFNPGPQSSVAQTYTNEASGTLLIDITPTGSTAEKTFITGNADIKGGNLNVFVGNGNYIAGTVYTIITGDVTGAFDAPSPILSGPGADFIAVELSTGSLLLTVLGDFIFPISILPFFEDEQSKIIQCLRDSNHPAGSDLALIIEALGTIPPEQLNKVLPNLSARRYGTLEWVNARNNSYVADLLSQRLYDNCCVECCCVNPWITIFGNIMSNKKIVDNLPRFNADAVGFLVGVDDCRFPHFSSGAAFGYTRTDILWRGSGGGGDTQAFYGAVYGGLDTLCHLRLNASFLGGGTCNDLKRTIQFSAATGNISRTARSNFWNYFYTAHLGISSDWEICGHILEPYVLGDYHYFFRKKFTEKGANSINLQVQSKNQELVRGESGLKWSYLLDCGTYCVLPYIGASWVGEFPLGKSRQPARFINQSCVINSFSFDNSVQFGSPQAGFKFTHCNGVSLKLGYKGLYNNRVTINEVDFSIDYAF